MENTILNIERVSAYFGETQALKSVSMSISEHTVTAVIGPSGCGKTTLIRCLNRLHEMHSDARIAGRVLLKGEDIYTLPYIVVRRKIGMVFQTPNPFPIMSIYDNVVAGYRLNGIRLSRSERDMIVEESLVNAALWDEVKDRLHKKGTFLSGGQQQRLCIARSLAMKPDILLLDEPTSALDPISTQKIEELIEDLKKTVSIILVTHNIAQAARISDNTAFMYLGELMEYGATQSVFTTPKNSKTEEYLSGKIG